MTIPQGGFSFMAFSPYTPPAPKVTRPNPLDRYTPVTDEMLAAPASSEWLTWRRTWDAHGFSPLNQITKANVGSLRVAWSWSLAARVQRGDAARTRRRAVRARDGRPRSGARCARAVICSGSTAASCRKACRRRSSAAWRSIAIACISGRRTPTSSRWTRGPASWCGTRASATRGCAKASPAASSRRAERSWWARPAPALAPSRAARRSSGWTPRRAAIAWRVNTIAQPGAARWRQLE